MGCLRNGWPGSVILVGPAAGAWLIAGARVSDLTVHSVATKEEVREDDAYMGDILRYKL